MVAGKSSMLDALSFALFGKPHRNINKSQLVNSINKKDSVVEVVFTIGKAHFKVVRGIKPNIFEIWKDGVMINQASHSKEYQRILEQNIIKLNHKSFHQIVVLGSSSFIPFMQLASQHRRDVIEDLLDINIFSKMNSLVKEKSSMLKDLIKNVVYDIELTKEKIDIQRKYIRDVENLSNDQVDVRKSEIETALTDIEKYQEENTLLTNEIEERQEGLKENIKASNDKKQSLLQFKAEFNQKIKVLVKETKFYEENDDCPTCSQSISKDLRSEKLSVAKDKATELQKALSDVSEQSSNVEKDITKFNTITDEIRDRTGTISGNNREITRLRRSD